VFRVGYGIFFGKTSNSTYYALRVENGIYQQTFTGCSVTSSNTSNQACAAMFPNVYFTPPGPALAAVVAGGVTPVAVCTTTSVPGASPTCPALESGTLPTLSQAVHGMDPSFVNPRAHEGEVTLEHQLPGNIAVSATYLVTRGLHLPSSYDANIAPSTATKSYDVLTSAAVGTVSNPTASLLTTTVPFYTTRLNPSTGIILNQYSAVNSWYNGLVLTIRKPMSHGIELLANYTYSKALDDGQTTGTNGTFFGTDDVLDPYNLHADYSYSDLDQRHRFVASIVWSPDYGHNMSNMAAREILDGWVASGTLTAATGLPYSAFISTSSFSNGAPDGGETGAEVSTFASSAGGRASWLPRNSYNLPTTANVDLRVERSFAIRERYKLDFSADAFNLNNSTFIQAVNTSAYSFAAAGSGACTGHANGCLVPLSTFQTRSTTTGSLYGARQLQMGFRLEF
jgi:hypothetical protein